MSRFFNFYDPLEKRYVFNSFLVVVALVEVLILVFTLIWKIDFEGIFLEQARPPVPFPWKEYLLASFTAPIVLLFLFGLIVQGFETLGREAPAGPGSRLISGGKLWRYRYLLGLAGLLALIFLIVNGKALFGLLAALIKALGLGGAYLLVALMAVALLYLPLRLFLRYRLEKKAMEYQYLLTLAARHGVQVVDPRLNPELAVGLEEKKISPPAGGQLLAPPPSREDPAAE